MAEDVVRYTAKSFAVSKTLIFNVVALVLAVLGMTELQDLLTPSQVALITGTVIPIGNMILRVYSVRPLAFVKPGQTKVVQVEKL